MPKTIAALAGAVCCASIANAQVFFSATDFDDPAIESLTGEYLGFMFDGGTGEPTVFAEATLTLTSGTIIEFEQGDIGLALIELDGGSGLFTDFELGADVNGPETVLAGFDDFYIDFGPALGLVTAGLSEFEALQQVTVSYAGASTTSSSPGIIFPSPGAGAAFAVVGIGLASRRRRA